MGRFHIPSGIFLLLLVAAGAIFAGCIGGQTPGPVQPTTPAGGTGPGLAIVSPVNGAVLPAGSITVSVRVTNFRLVPEYGQPYVEGEGHLHYYLSVGVPESSGSSSTMAPVSYIPTTATSYTWQDVPAGTYTFTVELANNDHSPMVPPATASVTVTVTGQLPANSVVTTTGESTYPTACVTDSDCVPDQCCHPTSCINRAFKGVCTELCTNVCSGPIDCGAGHCACVNGRCGVASGPAGTGP
jgi:hypothetical protein